MDNLIPTRAALWQSLRQSPIIKAVHDISRQLQTPVYLVGGAIRDLLLGSSPEKDYDFVTESSLEPVATRFAKAMSGTLIELSADPPNYRVIFYRHRRRIEVDFSRFQGGSLEQDLAHRDFTVNAIALQVDDLFRETGPIRLQDPLGGKEDLEQKNLRMASSQSFVQDPLRILRAVRIAKASNLIIASGTEAEMRRYRDQLQGVSTERIRNEFFKIMGLPHARESMKYLDNLGLLLLLFPEPELVSARNEKERPGEKHWERALNTVQWCEYFLENLEQFFPAFPEPIRAHFSEEIEADVTRHHLLKLGGFLAGFGRLSALAEPEENPLCEGDGKMTPDLSERISVRLKLGKKASRILKKMAENDQRPLALLQTKQLNSRMRFRFFFDLGAEGIEILALSWARLAALVPASLPPSREQELRTLARNLVEYYFNDFLLTSPQPLLSGEDLINRFGLKTGKTVGDILKAVARAEAVGLLSNPEEALLYVEKILAKDR